MCYCFGLPCLFGYKIYENSKTLSELVYVQITFSQAMTI